MGSVDELTDNDVKILKYVKKNGPSTINDIEQALPEIASVAYRIQVLSTPEYENLHSIRLSIENTSYLTQDYETKADESTGCLSNVPIGIYRLTDFGEKFIQDHEHLAKTHRQELWLKNAWIPIIVAFLTTLSTNYILPKLLQLLGLLFRTS